MSRLSLMIAMLAALNGAASTLADSPVVISSEEFGWSDVQLSNQPSASAVESARPSPYQISRLRQQRAAYLESQRLARQEANAWMGRTPLRPTWSPAPMTASRFGDGYTIFVPVYVP